MGESADERIPGVPDTAQSLVKALNLIRVI